MDNTQVIPEIQFLAINKMTLADAALAYAAMGFKVFPIQPQSKLPMQGMPWKIAATTDPEVVADWWRIWPTANIAIALGEESRAIALDIDVKGGQDGTRSYQAITQERYVGPVQKTPTGGVHLLFQYHPGLKNFTHKGSLGGLDMRTDGGYILAAPSQVEGQPYYWTQEDTTPPMPAALQVACEQWSTQSNTQVVEAPDVPEGLPDIHALNLQPKYLNYLLSGDVGPWQSDESRAIFAVAGALMRRVNNPGAVLGIMSDNEFVMACAERHRQFGNPLDWLWKYGISKIVSEAQAPKAADVFQPLTPVATDKDTPEGWITWADEGITKAQFAPDWIIRGLVERGQVGLVYGDSQALKSYLCLDMAVQVTLGGAWHDHDVVSPGKVLFIAGEGNAILWRRLEAFRQRHSIRSDALGGLGITASGLNLMDPTHLEYLKQQLDVMSEAPQLIFVDTLSRNAILDENNARDIAELVNICDAIAKAYNCTVILVHHTGTTNKTRARGSSALEANTDFRFKMERLESANVIRTKLDVQKLKGAAEPKDPIVFEADLVPLAGVLDDDMVVVKDLVLRRVDKEILREHIKKQAERGKLGAAKIRILNIAKKVITENRSPSAPEAGALREEIWAVYLGSSAEGSTPNRSNFNRDLNKLANGDWLTMLEADDGAIWYNLPAEI